MLGIDFDDNIRLVFYQQAIFGLAVSQGLDRCCQVGDVPLDAKMASNSLLFIV